MKKYLYLVDGEEYTIVEERREEFLMAYEDSEIELIREWEEVEDAEVADVEENFTEGPAESVVVGPEVVAQDTDSILEDGSSESLPDKEWEPRFSKNGRLLNPEKIDGEKEDEDWFLKDTLLGLESSLDVFKGGWARSAQYGNEMKFAGYKSISEALNNLGVTADLGQLPPEMITALDDMSPEQEQVMANLFGTQGSVIGGFELATKGNEYYKETVAKTEELNSQMKHFETGIGEDFANGDFGQATARAISGAIGSMPSIIESMIPFVGIASIVVRSAAAASGKAQEEGKNINLSTMAYSAVIGASEGLLELVSKKIGTTAFKSLLNKPKDIIKKSIKSLVLDTTKSAGAEGLSEDATFAINTLADYVYLDKEVEFNDGFSELVDTFIIGATMGGGVSSAGGGASALRTAVQTKRIAKILDKTEYENLIDAYKTKKTTKSLAELSDNENTEAFLNRDLKHEVSNGNMTIEEADAIRDNFKSSKRAVKAIQSIDIKPEFMADDLVDITEKIYGLQTERSKIDKDNLLPDTEALDNEIKLLQDTQKDLIIEGLTTQSTVSAQKVLDDAGADAEMMVVDDYAAIKRETDKLNKEEGLKGDKKHKASTGYGSIITRKGRPDLILINKQESFNDGVINTGAHEVLHAVLKTTLRNAAVQTSVGSALEAELIGLKSKRSKDTGDFESRLQQYKDAKDYSKNDRMEETLTLFSEALLNGDIAYNENNFTKIGDKIRRALSKYLGYEVKFDNGRDVYNFIKDYNKSITSGKGLDKGLQKSFKEGIKGKLVESPSETIIEEKIPVTKESKALQAKEEEAEIALKEATDAFNDDPNNPTLMDKMEAAEEAYDQALINSENSVDETNAVEDVAIDEKKEKKVYPKADKSKRKRSLTNEEKAKIEPLIADAQAQNKAIKAEEKKQQAEKLKEIEDQPESKISRSDKEEQLKAQRDRPVSIKKSDELNALETKIAKDLEVPISKAANFFAERFYDKITAGAKEITSKKQWVADAKADILTFTINEFKPNTLNRDGNRTTNDIEDIIFLRGGRRLSNLSERSGILGKSSGITKGGESLTDVAGDSFNVDNIDFDRSSFKDDTGPKKWKVSNLLGGGEILAQAKSQVVEFWKSNAGNSRLENFKKLPNLINNILAAKYNIQLNVLEARSGNFNKSDHDSAVKGFTEKSGVFSVKKGNVTTEVRVPKDEVTEFHRGLNERKANEKDFSYKRLPDESAAEALMKFIPETSAPDYKYASGRKGRYSGKATGLPRNLVELAFRIEGRKTTGIGNVESSAKDLSINDVYDAIGVFVNEKGDIQLKPGITGKSPESQTLLGLIKLEGRMITNELTRTEAGLDPMTIEDVGAGKNKQMFSIKYLSIKEQNKLTDRQFEHLVTLNGRNSTAIKNAIKVIREADDMSIEEFDKLFPYIEAMKKDWVKAQKAPWPDSEERIIAAFKEIEKEVDGLKVIQTKLNKNASELDYKFILNGKEIKLEAKKNVSARLGSLGIHYNAKTGLYYINDKHNNIDGKFRSDLIAKENEYADIFINGAASLDLNSNGIWITYDPSGKRKVQMRGRLYDLTVKAGYLKESTTKTILPAAFVTQYYSGKGGDVINFGDIGALALNDSETFVGMPRFNQEGVEVVVTTMWKPSFSKTTGIATMTRVSTPELTLKSKNILGASTSLNFSKPKEAEHILRTSSIKMSLNNNNLLPKNIRFTEGVTTGEVIRTIDNMDKAIDLASNPTTKRKGISVWDFDDTLATTKSNVLYTMPGDFVPNEKDFYKEFIAVHKDLRSKDKSKAAKSIMSKGFEAPNNVNSLPIYKGYEKATDVITSRFMKYKKGDVVYLLNKNSSVLGGNGYKTKAGYKPKASEVITITRDGQNVFEAWSEQNYPQKRLTAEEFAKEGDTYIANGAKFDFTEFSKIVKGAKGPLFDKAIARNKKFGNEDVFILTARPANSKFAIHEFLKGIGLNIPLENITGIADSDPNAKARWVVDKAAEGYNDFYFADDHIGNVKAVGKALNKLPVKSKTELAVIKKSNVKFSMNTRVPVKWENFSSDYELNLVGSMDVDNNKISLAIEDGAAMGSEILDFGFPEKTVEIGWAVFNEVGGQQQSERDIFKIFGAVINAAADRIKGDLKDKVDAISFSGAGKSRAKLYDLMTKRFAAELGWKYKMKTKVINYEPIELYDEETGLATNKMTKGLTDITGYYVIYKPDNKPAFDGQSEQVREVLKVVDTKSPTRVKHSLKPENAIPGMIARKKGLSASTVVSESEAYNLGKNKGRWNMFLPPNAEDFQGLMYKLYGKGEQGDKDMQYIKDKLLRPYNAAENALSSYRQNLANDYKALEKQLKAIERTGSEESLVKIKGMNYTADQAVRIYIWTKLEKDIPGITPDIAKQIAGIINKAPRLKAYAEGLMKVTKTEEQFPAPTETWYSSNVQYDLFNYATEGIRSDFLTKWKANVEAIFTPDAFNRMEAVFGTDYVKNLKQMLTRMETGRSRPENLSKEVSRGLDYINGSVGVIMWMNTRSAMLQTISAANYINWTDNNPLKIGQVMAENPKKFAKTLVEIFNSDFLRDRREGLRINVEEAEIAKAIAKGEGNVARRVFNALIKAGFKPTQIADSFAITMGGTPYYMNRVKTYEKTMSTAKAKKKAWEDFRDLTEENQQSSRQDRISNIQTGVGGRLIFAFNNTPFQMTRLQKKSYLDLINKRGDWKANVSKLGYYGVIQSSIFFALQQGLYSLLFSPDDDELTEADQKIISEDKGKRFTKLINSVFDSALSGSGIPGKALVTVKNTIMVYLREKEKGYRANESKVIEQAIGFSPPLGSKFGKEAGGMRSLKFNATKKGLAIMEKEDRSKWSPLQANNKAYIKMFSAASNIPLDRAISKVDNIMDALDDTNPAWIRISTFMGTPKYQLENDVTRKIREDKIPKDKIEPKLNSVEDRGSEIKNLRKDQQIDSLIKYGLTKKQIRDLKYESQRVDKIIELQDVSKRRANSLK